MHVECHWKILRYLLLEMRCRMMVLSFICMRYLGATLGGLGDYLRRSGGGRGHRRRRCAWSIRLHHLLQFTVDLDGNAILGCAFAQA